MDENGLIAIRFDEDTIEELLFFLRDAEFHAATSDKAARAYDIQLSIESQRDDALDPK